MSHQKRKEDTDSPWVEQADWGYFRKRVTGHIPPYLKEWVDQQCKQKSITQSLFINQLIESAYDKSKNPLPPGTMGKDNA